MRAAQISSFDGPAAVTVTDLPEPVAGEGQILIDVRAAGVTYPEVLQSRGQYQTRWSLPYVPGAEVAGVVLDAAEGSGFAAGERVVALPVAGGFAERVVAPATQTFRLPDEVTFGAGAAVGFNYLTAYFALVERARMTAGEDVLVHGAAGGVGTAAIQIAKAFGAGRVLAVTSTPEKGAVALEAGADAFVLADGFREEVTARGKVDLVVDPVGGDRFTDSLRCLRPGGRLLVIGFTGGEIPTVRVNRLLLNNIGVLGVGWGADWETDPGRLASQWAAILPYLQSGALRPILGRRFGLDDVTAALEELDERRATGKVLLVP